MVSDVFPWDAAENHLSNLTFSSPKQGSLIIFELLQYLTLFDITLFPPPSGQLFFLKLLTKYFVSGFPSFLLLPKPFSPYTLNKKFCKILLHLPSALFLSTFSLDVGIAFRWKSLVISLKTSLQYKFPALGLRARTATASGLLASTPGVTCVHPKFIRAHQTFPPGSTLPIPDSSFS